MMIGIGLILSQTGLAGDYYATPSGAGLQDGSNWANAFSQSQIDGTPSVVDSVMLAGDTLHLGSGTYSQTIHLSSSGTASSPKRIIGEDTGGGAPLIDMGNWSRTNRTSGANRAIGFGNAASYWVIENLSIRDALHGVRTDNLSAGQYVGITLRSLMIRNCRYGLVISDANEWLLEGVTALEYIKHGFRLDHNCQDMILRNCTADLSGGDTSWYAYSEAYPFGFFVDDPTENDASYGAGPVSSNITFEDCLALHHRTDEQTEPTTSNPNPYWNGDGFVINSGGNTGLYQFIRCRAIDNEDGGYDIKPPSSLIDCVAFQNARNFRFHTGNATMTNCVSGYPTKRAGAGNGLVGVWVHDPTVTIDFCTIHSASARGVEEDSAGQVTLTNSIISHEVSTGTTHTGSVTLGSGTVTYKPGSGVDPQYVNPHPGWDGVGTDMNSDTYGTTKGYFQDPDSVAADHRIVPTNIAPTIDGSADFKWDSANSQTIANVIVGSVANVGDLSGSFRTLWDATNLYVLVEVTDDFQRNDSGVSTWHDDSVEIYVDANNDKPTGYGSNDYQYRFTWNGSLLTIQETKHGAVLGVNAAWVPTAVGYTIEVQLPWSTLGQSSVAFGALLGLDVHINDDDDGGNRDGKKSWFNTADTSWQSPGTFATAMLQADHEVGQTASAPSIDGNIEASWNSANSQTIANIVLGSVTGGNDLSGSFRTLWDSSNLYLLVQVNDDAQQNDSGTQSWDDDSVEVYIDANNDRPASYGSDDYRYHFVWNGSSLTIKELQHNAVAGVVAARVATATGYIIEVQLPWSTLGQSSVAVNALLGLDLHINDDDDGGSRDGKKAWFNTADTSWQSPGTFATARLVGVSQ